MLTPTETAHILANANLQAHAASNLAFSKIAQGNVQTLKRNQTSISPYRGLKGADTFARKTTPTRSKQSKIGCHTPSKDSRFMTMNDSTRLTELQLK